MNKAKILWTLLYLANIVQCITYFVHKEQIPVACHIVQFFVALIMTLIVLVDPTKK
jgi:hypothetical protein